MALSDLSGQYVLKYHPLDAPTHTTGFLRLLAVVLLTSVASMARAGDTDIQAVTLKGTTVTAKATNAPPVQGTQVHIDRATIEHHNVVEVEDVLAFAPNLTIRKRYIGDRNAIIGGRAAGTTQSARSLVYADGLLLSDFLDSGYANPPRWGMVNAADIESIDVLYGPFSALYPGNAMGTTVLLHTRMPDRFRAGAEAQVFSQHFSDAYGEDRHLGGHAGRAFIGNRHGRWRWELSVSRLDNHGQPMSYVTARQGGNDATAVPVGGGTHDRNPDGSERLVAGPVDMDHTRQTQASLKLGVRLTPRLKARFTLGWWHNRSDLHGRSLLRDANGQVVDAGPIRVDGDIWTLPADAFAPSRRRGSQRLLGLQLDGHVGDTWQWQTVASRYDELLAREGDAAMPGTDAGTLADNGGSGWWTWDLRTHGSLGPDHTLYVGMHLDRYLLDSRVHATDDWRGDGHGALLSAFGGRTTTGAVYVQDNWSFQPDWLLTLGLRAERWRASDGVLADTDSRVRYPSRQASALSPKAALAWYFADSWQLRLSVGRAVRFPTVGELFQGSLSHHAIVDNDPDLAPERAWAEDLTLDRHSDKGYWRVSLFHYAISDSLYKQTDVTVTPHVRRVGNIDRVRIFGVAGAMRFRDVWPGVDVNASVAFNDAVTRRDATHPSADGKQFPRIPRVRAKLGVVWRFARAWQVSLAGRHSGRQYGSLDNTDHLDTFGAISRFTVFDAKLQWQASPAWTAALGVDNLTDRRYWVYHPWPGRTWLASLRWSKP